MQWLQFLQILLKYGPTIYSVVHEIIDLIDVLKPSSQPAAKAQLEAAVSVYRATGNRQPLRSLRDSLHQQAFTAVVRA